MWMFVPFRSYRYTTGRSVYSQSLLTCVRVFACVHMCFRLFLLMFVTCVFLRFYLGLSDLVYIVCVFIKMFCPVDRKNQIFVFCDLYSVLFLFSFSLVSFFFWEEGESTLISFTFDLRHHYYWEPPKSNVHWLFCQWHTKSEYTCMRTQHRSIYN